MAYSIRPDGWERQIESHYLARIITDRIPDHPDTPRHLAAIENLEARRMQYANHDFDVLSAALAHARTACPDYPRDPPGYGLLVAYWEAHDATTSDAQGLADIEFGLI